MLVLSFYPMGWGLFVAVVAGFLVGALCEEVGVGVCAPVAEVEDSLWIDGVAHEAGFEVEVWASASTGVAGEGDRLTCFHILVGLHEEARKVTIYGFEAVFVTNNHIEAVSAALILGETNSAAECCVNGVADRCAKIHALVYRLKRAR